MRCGDSGSLTKARALLLLVKLWLWLMSMIPSLQVERWGKGLLLNQLKVLFMPRLMQK